MFSFSDHDISYVHVNCYSSKLRHQQSLHDGAYFVYTGSICMLLPARLHLQTSYVGLHHVSIFMLTLCWFILDSDFEFMSS